MTDPNKAAADKAAAEKAAAEKAAEAAAPAKKAVKKADEDTRTVRVNRANLRVGPDTAYIHPESRILIRDELVEVPDDAWTQEYLANRFLTEK